MLTLILASQSPRRRELLKKAGFEFHTHSMEISEIINENLSLDDALQELARQKSEALLHSDKLLKYKKFLVLSADTVVVVDGEVIGKPRDLEDAEAKLRLLSGRSHLVKTAVCLQEFESPKDLPLKWDSQVETSEVFFNDLQNVEIHNYVIKHRPLDKAGAYGVQDVPKGFISRVDGNLDNVMGLPVKMVKEMLNKNGWRISRGSI